MNFQGFILVFGYIFIRNVILLYIFLDLYIIELNLCINITHKEGYLIKLFQ